MSIKMHVKTGDEVIVRSGKDKGKKGKVLSVNKDKGTVVVEGVSMATKHKKPRRMGETGGIIKQELRFMPARLCMFATSAELPQE